MPVDPELTPILAELSALPPLAETPLELLRQGAPFPRLPPAQLARVSDRSVPTSAGRLRVRVYQPREAAGLPVLLYFHGGGFVVGTLDDYDSLLRILALEADCLIVSVEYRLAPEHPFPAAVDDCVAATRWVHAHAPELGADPKRVALGGDSAGGNLAAVVALALRDSGGPAIAGQMLIYPVTRLRGPAEGSMLENGEGYFLTARDMSWFAEMYLGKSGDASHPHASPLLASDLSGLPPALVITAQYDPLRDEGDAYARRLGQSGVPCTHTCYPGAIHGFFVMPAAIGRRALAQAAGWLREIFARGAAAARPLPG